MKYKGDFPVGVTHKGRDSADVEHKGDPPIVECKGIPPIGVEYTGIFPIGVEYTWDASIGVDKSLWTSPKKSRQHLESRFGNIPMPAGGGPTSISARPKGRL